jgi:hypothetical protein
MKAPAQCWVLFVWLGIWFWNITFAPLSDEDVSELRKLMDQRY